MNLKTILDTLEAARLATTDLSLADDLRIAHADLSVALTGDHSILDLSVRSDTLDAIQNHVEANPLAQTRPDDNLSATLTCLVEWMETLEGLAQ